MSMDTGDEPRPSSNCKISHSVKGYCQCFGKSWYCSDACRCESCNDTEANEAFVEERAEIVLRKRRSSFGSSKGCTCIKSECQKNYCLCFKNRVACTLRCQCKGCANTHGPEGGTPGECSGASDGSDGTCMITDKGSLSPTESRVGDNFAMFGQPSNVGQHVCAPSDSSHVALLNSLPDRDYFPQNFHTLMHQTSVQTMQHGRANSTLCGLFDPNIKGGTQDGPNGN